MKHIALLLLFLVSAAEAIQPSPLPPIPTELSNDKLKPCELSCSCKPAPGEVDKCSMYWAFKSNNNGNIIREVNPDTGACVAAGKNNVNILSVYFGKSPQISLPTKEMATLAGTLVPPPKGPLPYTRKLDTAATVVFDDPLDKQITLQTLRVLALADDERSFAIVGGDVSQWQSAKVAAQRLRERVEGAEKSLSLAKPWPKLQDFAPLVWNLAICQHNNPAEVSALDVRIADKDDIAWNFAFARDWVDLQAPFDLKTSAKAKGLSNFDTIVLPFFAESEIVVKEREEKSLFTLLELHAFRTAVTETEEAIKSYTQHLESRVNERRKELELAFTEESNAIARIRDLLREQNAAVARLRTGVEAAATERAKLQASIEKLRVEIASNTSSLQGTTLKRDQKRVDRVAANTEATVRRTAVDDALQKLQAVMLNCGGQSYDMCSDAAAKNDFDRRRYEANQVVVTAKTALWQAQTMLTKIDGELLSDEKTILALRGKIADMNLQHDTLRSTRDTQDKNLIQIRAKLQVQEAEMVSLSERLANLHKAVDELSKVRPKVGFGG